ncbi:unnamed protein product [Diabrotica balteata]|uniref:Repressor of the inhibitor of the protein kinase n=1 Tax=Diabrotica balteata TaxID=107213 RepID=A0A9N9T5U8_DIABA|nr:unnamed protein product [Diabrotica balteata]
MCNIFSLTLPFSKLLQKPDIDLKCALKHFTDITKALASQRNTAIVCFKDLFQEAKDIAEKTNFDISIPRISQVQKNRANHTIKDPETYFRVSVFLSILDSLIEDTKSCSPEETLEFYNFHVCMPEYLITVITNSIQNMFEKIECLVRRYSELFDMSQAEMKCLLKGELQLWEMQWKDTDEFTKTALDALDSCNRDLFPTVSKLLLVLATLPISNASAEHLPSRSTISTIKMPEQEELQDEAETDSKIVKAEEESLNVQVSYEKQAPKRSIFETPQLPQKKRMNVLLHLLLWIIS